MMSWIMLKIPNNYYENATQVHTIEIRQKAKWLAPLSERLRMNFNGASRHNPKALGVGYIIRDEARILKWAISKTLMPSTNNKAKLEALLEGLKLCA